MPKNPEFSQQNSPPEVEVKRAIFAFERAKEDLEAVQEEFKNNPNLAGKKERLQKTFKQAEAAMKAAMARNPEVFQTPLEEMQD